MSEFGAHTLPEMELGVFAIYGSSILIHFLLCWITYYRKHYITETAYAF